MMTILSKFCLSQIEFDISAPSAVLQTEQSWDKIVGTWMMNATEKGKNVTGSLLVHFGT